MGTKPIWNSRTIWSIALALIAQLAAVFGLDIDVSQWEAIPDGGISLMEILTVVLTIAAVYFRYLAQHRLTIKNETT